MHPRAAFERSRAGDHLVEGVRDAHNGIEVRPQHFFQALAVGTLSQEIEPLA